MKRLIKSNTLVVFAAVVLLLATTSCVSSSAGSDVSVPEGWLEYRANEMGLVVYFPPDWMVSVSPSKEELSLYNDVEERLLTIEYITWDDRDEWPYKSGLIADEYLQIVSNRGWMRDSDVIGVESLDVFKNGVGQVDSAIVRGESADVYMAVITRRNDAYLIMGLAYTTGSIDSSAAEQFNTIVALIED